MSAKNGSDIRKKGKTMSRLKEVIKDASEYQSKYDLRPSDARLTNFYLKQISETLAMIYDDGFAEEIVIKEKEEDDYGYYRCRYSKERCKYADDFGWCMGNLGCMYKQREKND